METEKKKTFDIGMLARERQADYEIVEDDGTRTGWIWTFAGPGHPATIAADNSRGQEYLDLKTEQDRAQVNGRKWKGEAPTIAQRRAEGISYVVERLLGWSEMTMHGEPFPCTPENAKAVLSNPDMPSLWEQTNTFLMAEKSFMKRSAKS